jgi:hypothetical protein
VESAAASEQGSLTLSDGREEPIRQNLAIGRGPGNDISLTSRMVSRRHAVLRFEAGRWHIEDQGSANGTYVNDAIRSAESSDDGDVGGTDTDKIEADLDVVAAVNDLVELARGFGGPDLDPIEGAEAEQLRSAVGDAKLQVWTGDDDRLLRRLRIEADFDPTFRERCRSWLVPQARK